MALNLWLDDIRDPIFFRNDADFKWVKTVAEAQEYLMTGQVELCSLDHDLGACDNCMEASGCNNTDDWITKSSGMAMPNCEHFGTGYDLVCWMEANNIWPNQKPTVHSANPVGRARMQRVIDLNWAKRS